MQNRFGNEPWSVVGCQQFAVVSRNSPTPANGDLWQFVAGLEAIALLVVWLMWMVDVRVKKWLAPKPPRDEP